MESAFPLIFGLHQTYEISFLLISAVFDLHIHRDTTDTAKCISPVASPAELAATNSAGQGASGVGQPDEDTGISAVG